MKKNWLLLLIIIGFSACQNKPENQNVVLKGQIKNAPVQQIILDNVQNKPVDTIFMDKQGNFADTLKLPEAYYKLNVGQQYTWLYLKPGFNLTVNTDYKDFDNQLVYEGEGAEVNNYLAKKMLLDIALEPKTNYQYYGQLDEQKFLKLLDSVDMLHNNLLKNIGNSNFKRLELLTNSFEKSNLLNLYPRVRSYMIHNQDFKVSKSFPNPYKNIDINDPLIKKTPGREAYVIDYVEQLVRKRKSNGL